MRYLLTIRTRDEDFVTKKTERNQTEFL